MADEHENKEAEVSLSLPRDVLRLLDALPATEPMLALIAAHLVERCRRQKAAQAVGTATDAATVVLDEMKFLDPPEPIELEDDE